jgi:hypothetical protein
VSFIQILHVGAKLLAVLQRARPGHIDDLRSGSAALPLRLRRRGCGLLAKEAVAAGGGRLPHVLRHFVPEAAGGGRARLHRVHELGEISGVPCAAREKRNGKFGGKGLQSSSSPPSAGSEDSNADAVENFTAALSGFFKGAFSFDFSNMSLSESDCAAAAAAAAPPRDEPDLAVAPLAIGTGSAWLPLAAGFLGDGAETSRGAGAGFCLEGAGACGRACELAGAAFALLRGTGSSSSDSEEEEEDEKEDAEEATAIAGCRARTRWGSAEEALGGGACDDFALDETGALEEGAGLVALEAEALAAAGALEAAAALAPVLDFAAAEAFADA